MVCDKCNNEVNPINGQCPICGNMLNNVVNNPQNYINNNLNNINNNQMNDQMNTIQISNTQASNAQINNNYAESNTNEQQTNKPIKIRIEFIIIPIIVLVVIIGAIVIINVSNSSKNIKDESYNSSISAQNRTDKSKYQNTNSDNTTVKNKSSNFKVIEKQEPVELALIDDKETTHSVKNFLVDNYTEIDKGNSAYTKEVGAYFGSYDSHSELINNNFESSPVDMTNIKVPITVIDNEFEKTTIEKVQKDGLRLVVTFQTINKTDTILSKKMTSLALNDYLLRESDIEGYSALENFKITIAKKPVEYKLRFGLSEDNNSHSQIYREFNLDFNNVNKISFKNELYYYDDVKKNVCIYSNLEETYLQNKTNYVDPIKSLTQIVNNEYINVYIGKNGFTNHVSAEYFYYLYVENKTDRKLKIQINPFYLLNDYISEKDKDKVNTNYDIIVFPNAISGNRISVDSGDAKKAKGHIEKLGLVLKVRDELYKDEDGQDKLIAKGNYIIIKE